MYMVVDLSSSLRRRHSSRENICYFRESSFRELRVGLSHGVYPRSLRSFTDLSFADLSQIFREGL